MWLRLTALVATGAPLLLKLLKLKANSQSWLFIIFTGASCDSDVEFRLPGDAGLN